MLMTSYWPLAMGEWAKHNCSRLQEADDNDVVNPVLQEGKKY